MGVGEVHQLGNVWWNQAAEAARAAGEKESRNRKERAQYIQKGQT